MASEEFEDDVPEDVSADAEASPAEAATEEVAGDEATPEEAHSKVPEATAATAAGDTLSIDVHGSDGDVTGTVELDGRVFGIEPNQAVMHQVVTAQLAAARVGSANTKTRSEVRGGGAKPWRQKGTGRARHGSIRSPQWKGGGAVFGPKPRSYAQRTPKRIKNLALRSALSDRARAERVRVLDDFDFDEPSTKAAKQVLGALDTDGRPLIVISDWDDDDTAVRSFRNIPDLHLIPADQLNAYDVLRNDTVIFTQASLRAATEHAVRRLTR